MAEYLVSGRSPEGKWVTERIDTNSADEAVRLIRDRGYEDVVLHDDDVSALYNRQSVLESDVTPGQYLWFRRLPAPLASFLIITLNLYRKSWLVTLGGVSLLILRRSMERPWGIPDWIVISFMLLPVFFATAMQFLQGSSEAYNRLIESIAWGRWEEALGEIEAVEGVPPEEVAFRKAQALAGLGRLDEGLGIIAPFGDGVAIPEWLYHSRVAELHETAKQYDDARASTRTALEVDPGNATLLLDLARQEIWYHRDCRHARDLVARAREGALSDLLGPLATSIEGMIDLEEGRPREARARIEQALEQISAFRHASPLIGQVLDLMHAVLTLACAGEGDIAAANRHYRHALPRLQALRLDHLIARCERAIGLPQAV